MGLYDNVICRYPLPGTPPAFVGPGHEFQTKSLGSDLNCYEITAEGRLILPTSYHLIDQWPDCDVEFYSFVTIDTYGHPTGQNGLYRSEGVIYRATFVEGQLAGIVEVERGVYPKEEPLRESDR